MIENRRNLYVYGAESLKLHVTLMAYVQHISMMIGYQSIWCTCTCMWACRMHPDWFRWNFGLQFNQGNKHTKITVLQMREGSYLARLLIHSFTQTIGLINDRKHHIPDTRTYQWAFNSKSRTYDSCEREMGRERESKQTQKKRAHSEEHIEQNKNNTRTNHSHTRRREEERKFLGECDKENLEFKFSIDSICLSFHVCTQAIYLSVCWVATHSYYSHARTHAHTHMLWEREREQSHIHWIYLDIQYIHASVLTTCELIYIRVSLHFSVCMCVCLRFVFLFFVLCAWCSTAVIQFQ